MSSGDRHVLIYPQPPKYVLGWNAFHLEYASHGASTRSEVMSDWFGHSLYTYENG
jgi:hypothetical protein